MEPPTEERIDQNPRIIPDAVVKELFQKMLGVYYIEERLKILTRQGKVSFLASTRGHEKVQVGTVMLMKPGHDWFFTYYREKAVAYALGMSFKDIFLLMPAASDSSSTAATCGTFFVAQTSSGFTNGMVGTQYLPAVGMANSPQRWRAAIVYVSSGEGATSEAIFEAMNWATRENCQSSSDSE
jgi:TPP-dependent pyruvate/acetoin dehydrogenase alpha subunit